MRKVREILRLRFEAGLTTREVAQSCKVSCATVSEYGIRFREAGLSWPPPEDMDDYHQARSEAWQESERGEAFLERTDTLIEIIDLLEELSTSKAKEKTTS